MADSPTLVSRFIRSRAVRLARVAAGILVLGACGNDEQPKTPLAQMTGAATDTALPPNHPPIGGTGAAATAPPLPEEARTALASGNASYRAKDFEAALKSYRAAAAAAPDHPAPYFGIQMAASALDRPAVADSARRRISELSGRSDSAELDPHAGAAKAPPPARKGATP